MSDRVRDAAEEAHRQHWASVLSAALRITRDLDTAEECAQEAFARALTAWQDELPSNPGGWLAVTARRFALDRVRREQTRARSLPLLVMESERPQVAEGDPLRLLLMCCHPSLSHDAQVTITLRLMCGLTTAQIARVLLTGEPTIAARLTRAKRKIATAAIPFRLPPVEVMADRLGPALDVVYLAYTAGHTDAEGTTPALARGDLATRAMVIARRILAAAPGHSEAGALLALMLFHEARRDTRTSADGSLTLLADQDRSRWDPTLIREALGLITSALETGDGRFAYEAAIAGVHAVAPSFDETDWPQIVTLYDRLHERHPTPVVALNRAAARSLVAGADLDAVLAEVETLAEEPSLRAYPYVASTRARILERLGRWDDAATAYAAAYAVCGNQVEREFLRAKERAARREAIGEPPSPEVGSFSPVSGPPKTD